MYKEKQIKDLSDTEIHEILYLSQQSNGRIRLITNLYGISTNVLEQILIKYSHGKIFEKHEVDFS